MHMESYMHSIDFVIITESHIAICMNIQWIAIWIFVRKWRLNKQCSSYATINHILIHISFGWYWIITRLYGYLPSNIGSLCVFIANGQIVLKVSNPGAVSKPCRTYTTIGLKYIKAVNNSSPYFSFCGRNKNCHLAIIPGMIFKVIWINKKNSSYWIYSGGHCC